MGMSLAMGLSLTAIRRAGGGLWSPSELLTGASQLAYYDPSDLSTLFDQDNGGATPITADGQSVGLVLDKSQGLVPGPELVTNGGFDDATGWIVEAGWTISGGVATRVPDSSATSVARSISLTGGKAYQVTYTIVSYTSGNFLIRFLGGTIANGVIRNSAGTFTEVMIARTGNNSLQCRMASGTGAVVVDNISVRELPGNHLVQSTLASRPLYKTDGTLHWLQFDGSDDFLVSAANLDPGAVDKAQIWAGVRKNNDTSSQLIAEMSVTSTTTDYTFGLLSSVGAGGGDRFSSRGTGRRDVFSTNAAPVTLVHCGLADISAPFATFRTNGVEAETSTLNQGTLGNFASHPLYIGRRGGSTLPFNGNIYSLLIRFSAANLAADVIDSAEEWTAGKTGVTL